MRKLSELFEIMKKSEAEAIIVSDPYNIRYLCGFSGGEGYLYVSEKRCVMLVDSRYTVWAENECTDNDVVTISMDYYSVINEFIMEDGVKCVLFEGKKLTYYDYHSMKKNLKCSVSALDNELDELRMIKDDYEIEMITEAERIGDEAFSYIISELCVGMSEKEVALKLEMYMRTHGADGLSFEVIAASGTDSASPHAMPGERKLTEGDFITMDFGCTYKGYCSDMTRTVCIGKASEKQKMIYELVLLAQKTAIENLRAGISGVEGDAFARDVIENAGYGDFFGHGLGHGVGLFIHEEPRLSPKGETILKPKMAVTVEPGIYLPNEFGVRIEDVVIIRENGVDNITHSDKKLIEIY